MMPITPRTIFHMTSNQGGANGLEAARQSATIADDVKTCSDPHLFSWPWSAVLMARVAPCAEDGSNQGVSRLLFLAPTARGLEALEHSEQAIANLWLVALAPDDKSPLRVETIDQISSWSTRTPTGRQLIVLHGRAGHLLAIEDEHLFSLKSISTDWTGSGTYFQPWSADSEVNDGTVETSGS